MATVSELKTVLSTNVQPFQRGMKQAQKSLFGLSSGFGSVASKAIAAAAAFVSLRAATSALTSDMQELDELNKSARGLGIQVEQLQRLNHAIGLASSVGTSEFVSAMQKMQKGVSEAAMGTGQARRSFQELGLSAAYLKSLSPDQQFLAIADAISKVPSAADQTRMAMDIFGRSGAQLLPVLKEGAGGIAALGNELDSLGAVFSEQQLAGIEAANDAATRVKKSFGAIVSVAAVELAPAIETVSKLIVDGFKVGSVVVREWYTIVDIAVNTAVLGFASWAENVKFIFTSVFPALFKSLPTLVKEVFENILANAAAFYDSLIGALQGKGFTFAFVGLSDAFAEELRKIPKLTDRTLTEFERNQISYIRAQQARLNAAMANALGAGSQAGLQAPAAGPRSTSLSAFTGFGAKILQGLLRQASSIQIPTGGGGANTAVLKGSTEAAALEAERRRGGQDIQKSQLAELKEIKTGILRLANVGAATGTKVFDAVGAIF